MSLTPGKYTFPTLSNFAVLEGLMKCPTLSLAGQEMIDKRTQAIKKEIAKLQAFADANPNSKPATYVYDMAQELQEELDRILSITRPTIPENNGL